MEISFSECLPKTRLFTLYFHFMGIFMQTIKIIQANKKTTVSSRKFRLHQDHTPFLQFFNVITFLYDTIFILYSIQVHFCVFYFRWLSDLIASFYAHSCSVCHRHFRNIPLTFEWHIKNCIHHFEFAVYNWVLTYFSWTAALDKASS